MITKQTIDDFYKCKRLAIIGVSRKKSEYSRMLFRDLISKGYEVVPVNPNVDVIDDTKCYKSIKDIHPAVDRAIMLLPADKTEATMIECAEAGVKTVWMHNHIASGVQNTKAIYQAEKNNIQLLTGFCPFMFMPKTGFIHRLHGNILKLMRAYPK